MAQIQFEEVTMDQFYETLEQYRKHSWTLLADRDGTYRAENPSSIRIIGSRSPEVRADGTRQYCMDFNT